MRFAPGTSVTLCVLKPGEQTKPIRHNSALINFCIRGAGQTRIDGKCIKFGLYDVWNTPGWATYENYNDTNELQVRLMYSNAALLEKMQVHVIDENPPAPGDEKKSPAHTQDKSPFGTFQLTEDGAYLMPYEQLINPEMAPHKALHFEWKKVKQELDKLASLGQCYRGRRLYLLYNPATLNTNGTTCEFLRHHDDPSGQHRRPSAPAHRRRRSITISRAAATAPWKASATHGRPAT